MKFFKRQKREITVNTDEQQTSESLESQLLKAFLNGDEVTRDLAMNIPSVSACVNKISETVANLQVKMYIKGDDGNAKEVKDYRVPLLNDETGDTLDGFQFKKAMVVDMLLEKGGYAYVNKINGKIKSIHYVDTNRVSFLESNEPIFKDYKVMVDGKQYEGFQFIKLLRQSKNGYSGRSIIQDNPLLFSILYNTEMFEENLVKTGGNKKGFLESTNRLSDDAMRALKEAFTNLYSNKSENVMVLNEGLSFKESSNTSVEMQLSQNKLQNSDDTCKVFLIPPSIMNGNASNEDRELYYEQCINPILERFSTALNAVLLTENEKGKKFFAFDVTGLNKTNILDRFNAYAVAIKNGFMQVDEVRKKENLESFKLDFIKLGLQDVLYYPETGEIYTPNTGMSNYTSKEGSGVPVTPDSASQNPNGKRPRQPNEPTANMKNKAEKAGGVMLGMVTKPKGGEEN